MGEVYSAPRSFLCYSFWCPGQSHERPLPPLQGEGRESDVCDWTGWGANGGLIDETTARKPHPPPDLPLEGGGVDAYGIHAIALGLGLGLQKIASNYVSGFIILLDRSICLGNLITLDDKTTGLVTQITTRYTVLNLQAGTEVIIPNEYLVNNMVRNLSFTDKRLRATAAVQIAYDADLEKAMALLIEAATQQSRVLANPAPGVVITELAASGINLELGFWVADPELGTGGVRSEIYRTILRSFRENGIDIPYPTVQMLRKL